MADVALPAQIRTLPMPERPSVRQLFEFRVPRHILYSRYTLPIPNLPAKLAGLRVLHLTDIHLTRRWMPALDRLHERVAENPPDLICITGDFVEAKHDTGAGVPNVLRMVGGLRSRLGIYGMLGNHDGDILPIFVPDWPVRVLFNETLALRDGDTAIELVGWHGVDPSDASSRFAQGLSHKPPNTLRMAMVHYPAQVLRFADKTVDVVMAGHTHGGQVCLPGGWPLMTHDALPRRYARGVHQFGDRWLVVGRGVGFSTYQVRAFCPAEAIELTLVPA